MAGAFYFSARNGFVFVTNASGAKSDAQIANEGRDVNASWDAVWTVAAKRDAGGWSAELRIPFKTLRFERGTDRIWGVDFSRRIRRKNEIDYWSPAPRLQPVPGKPRRHADRAVRCQPGA